MDLPAATVVSDLMGAYGHCLVYVVEAVVPVLEQKRPQTVQERRSRGVLVFVVQMPAPQRPAA